MAGGSICIRNDERERREGDTVSDLGLQGHWPSINPWGHTSLLSHGNYPQLLPSLKRSLTKAILYYPSIRYIVRVSGYRNANCIKTDSIFQKRSL